MLWVTHVQQHQVIMRLSHYALINATNVPCHMDNITQWRRYRTGIQINTGCIIIWMALPMKLILK